MKTLLLTSSGMKNMADEVLKLLHKPPSQTTIAHITTATKPSSEAPWMDADKAKMLEMGFQVTDIDIEGKTKRQLETLLHSKDIIYVQGGDPYFLLKHVRQSGFDVIVMKLIDEGILYIGSSAGSYVACPTMEMALWKNPKRKRYGLAGNEPAMNLVPFLITAHYEPSFETAIRENASSCRYPVRILTDDQAILVKNGVAEFVGKGKEIVFQDL